MPMSKQNKKLGMEVLNGASLREAAAKYGKSHVRAGQITLYFCKEYMLHHEKFDDDGNMKDLRGLRAAWWQWMEV